MGRFTNDATGQIISVADEKDHRFGEGWTRDGAAPKATKSETPDETWTIAELTEHADANSIDLLGATKKADILSAYELHNSSQA